MKHTPRKEILIELLVIQTLEEKAKGLISCLQVHKRKQDAEQLLSNSIKSPNGFKQKNRPKFH